MSFKFCMLCISTGIEFPIVQDNYINKLQGQAGGDRSSNNIQVKVAHHACSIFSP